MSLAPYEPLLLQIPEYRFGKQLTLYVPPVLLVLGSLGNALSFVILRRRAMLQVSSYHYLAGLALADTLVLYIGLLRLWLEGLTGSDVQDGSDWACKLTVSLGYAASDLSVWLIIAVTVERYLVVCFPLKASALISPRRAKKVMGLLGLLMLGLNLHFFWTVQLVPTPLHGARNVSQCQAAPQHQRLVRDVWPWVDALVYSFLPTGVITVLNVLIVREVLRARNHRHRLQSTWDLHHHHHHHFRRHYQGEGSSRVSQVSACLRRSQRAGHEGRKLTVMLLSVSFTFLLTTLPMNVTLIVTALWGQHTDRLQHAVRFQLARTVAELLMYVNHSANFFLYCATGHKFRQELRALLTCRRKAKVTGPVWSSLRTDDTRCSPSLRSNRLTSLQDHALSTHAPSREVTDARHVSPTATKV